VCESAQRSPPCRRKGKNPRGIRRHSFCIFPVATVAQVYAPSFVNRTIMNVLIALDASRSSTAIIGEIAARKWSKETCMRVLYVVQEMAFTSDFVDVESYVNAENDAAVTLIKNCARLLQRHGIRTSAAILKGRPAKIIVDYAKQWGADVIVMGASHTGAIVSFFLGSTAKDVLRHAPCSVEIIKTTDAWPKPTGGEVRVLLATDGSSSSLAAARALAAREWPSETRIKIVSAMPEGAAAIEPLRGLRFSGADLTGQRYLVEPAQEALRSTKKIIEDAGLCASDELLFGNPREVITDHARKWGADLIVVGSHGRRGLERMFESSVSEAVVAHAPCSVAVIHDMSYAKAMNFS
jgi:nucleotide-binding universal stress UspA family protein